MFPLSVPAHFAHMKVVHDREKPGSEMCAGLVEMGLGEASNDSFLNQVIRCRCIAAKRKRIALQRGDILFDLLSNFVHF